MLIPMTVNFVVNARKAVFMKFMLILLLLEEQSNANIVSLPHRLYVLEGDRGTIRCQNRSTDGRTFYSYVLNPVWKRHNATDNTNVSIEETSGPMYSSGHTLNFNPFSSEHQGEYFCCLPNVLDCSERSIVTQSILPSIRASNSNYTAVVGSQITMECYIEFMGVPTATFKWSKDGNVISSDIISTNSSLALTLRNVTMEDAGVYTCIARNVFSYRNDHVELRVIQQTITEHPNDFGNTSFSQLTVRVLAENISTTCQNFQISAPIKLERYIYEQYNHNVSINATKILCNNDESVAICDFQFFGSSAKTALQLIINDLNNSSDGLDLSTYRLRLCLNCSELNVTSEKENGPGIDKNNDDDDDDDSDKIIMMVILVLLVMVMVLIIVVGLFCIIAYLRCKKKKRNITCLPMQKCVINASPTLTSSGQYNRLQFNYNTESNLQAGTQLLMPREDPSLFHFIPSNSHQSHNMQHLTSNIEMYSDHANATSHNENSNNGYVLPDDFGKFTPKNLKTNAQTDKRSEATHKPTVIIKSDGTGIIQTSTGTLQVVIPASSSDDTYTVVPSQTHESYFDVLKNT